MLKKSEARAFLFYERAAKNHVFSGSFHPVAVDGVLKNTFSTPLRIDLEPFLFFLFADGDVLPSARAVQRKSILTAVIRHFARLMDLTAGSRDLNEQHQRCHTRAARGPY